MQIKAEFNHSL